MKGDHGGYPRTNKGNQRRRRWDDRGSRGRGTAAGVHLISAITDPLLFCQIGVDLILSAAGDRTPVRTGDDSFTGNWRTVTVTGDCIQLVS